MTDHLLSIEDEWRRRRDAAVADSAPKGRRSGLEDELFKRRGGGGSAPIGGRGVRFAVSVQGKSSPELRADIAPEIRTKHERLEALAKGSQPAVVKMASYGGGGRFGAMANYISRDGEISIETEQGVQLSGREDLARLREEWSPLFQNRSDSRDVAEFNVRIDGDTHADEGGLHAAIRTRLNSGFGNRRYAYSVHQPHAGRLEVRGVLVLRSTEGQRLTGDADAAVIVQSRYDQATAISTGRTTFAFSGHGNGVEYTTAKLKALVEKSGGDVHDERGRDVATVKDASSLSQKEWRQELHSRKGRDVMHVIMSAKAGTDVDAFRDAARDFLAEQFEGHRYAFSLHDPMNDPKERAEGGKRPHIHVHALVAMRNDHGERITTSPQVFRQWRVLLAEKSRERGIAMEMTDRRELASAPAFTRNQVKPVSRAGRTHHVGTSEAAQMRYANKRSEARVVATTAASLAYSYEAKQTWAEIAASNQHADVAQYAATMEGNLSRAINSSLEGLRLSVAKGEFGSEYEGSLRNVAEIVREGEVMRNEMTREQIDIYAASVAKALSNLEKTVEPTDRDEFERISKAATDTVAAHRKVFDLTEELEKAQSEARPNSLVREAASLIAELSPTRQAAAVIGHAVMQAVGPKEPEEKQDQKASEGKIQTRSLPAEVTERYFVQQSVAGTTRVFTNSKASRELFQDAGERLRSKTFDATAVKLMVETAAHRGWTSVEIAGSKEFRREAWLEGQARGIAVKGHQPTELDWQEVSRREQAHLKNEIRNVDEKVTTEKVSAEIATDAKVATTAPVQAKSGFRDGVTGVLVEQGSKPYQGKPENEPSPYAILKTQEGDKTIWGVDIPDAISRADAKEGDTITLREMGIEKVEKTIIKEVDGNKVKSLELVDRRVWEAEVVSEKTQQLSEVEPSSEGRSVVEHKAQVKAEASTSEPAAQQPSRLQQLEQEEQAKRDQSEQER